jgi:glycosyltransferase involved in cell wall biosynthesis
MTPKILVVAQLPPPHHGSNVMAKIFYDALVRIGFQVTFAEKVLSKRIEDLEKITFYKIIKAPFIAIRIALSALASRPQLCFYFPSVKAPTIYLDLVLIFLMQVIVPDVVLYFHGKGYKKLTVNKNSYLKAITQKIFSNCTGAIVLGEALKDDVGWIFNNNRLFILPNCVEDMPPRVTSYRKFHPKKGPLTILYLSNLIPTKGSFEFVQMAKRIIKFQRNVKFLLAGATQSKSFTNEIKAYIKIEKLYDFVQIVGPVYDSEKEKVLVESDIFVFPTYYELEAFPLVNIEAMRAGLPVVSSNEGSIPEAIIDGVNGFIVNPKNISEMSEKVLMLIRDDSLRIEMGKKGRQLFINNYTPDAYMNKLKAAVEYFS